MFAVRCLSLWSVIYKYSILILQQTANHELQAILSDLLLHQSLIFFRCDLFLPPVNKKIMQHQSERPTQHWVNRPHMTVFPVVYITDKGPHNPHKCNHNKINHKMHFKTGSFLGRFPYFRILVLLFHKLFFYDGADFFSFNNFYQIAFLIHIKYNYGQFIFFA